MEKNKKAKEVSREVFEDDDIGSFSSCSNYSDEISSSDESSGGKNRKKSRKKKDSNEKKKKKKEKGSEKVKQTRGFIN